MHIKILILSIAVFITLEGFSQKAKTGAEVLELKETTHDFGKIPQGRPVTYNFVVVNRGSTPLLLENVQATCGCTSPEWAQGAIPVNGQSIIKVGFNAAAEGQFSKNITINFNQSQSKVLVIKGDVFATPATPAPVNASITAIKQINQ